MANQKQTYSKHRYYTLLKWLLIIFIIGRIFGVITMIANYGKPKDKMVIEFMKTKMYDLTMIIAGILDICFYIFVLWFIGSSI